MIVCVCVCDRQRERERERHHIRLCVGGQEKTHKLVSGKHAFDLMMVTMMVVLVVWLAVVCMLIGLCGGSNSNSNNGDGVAARSLQAQAGAARMNSTNVLVLAIGRSGSTLTSNLLAHATNVRWS